MEINIGLLVRDLRKKQGHTLKELSEKVNFDLSNLSKIERGERKPTFELLESVAKLYDVPMSYFFREREAPEGIDVKWYTLIREQEDKGYTPEEIDEIIKLVEQLRGTKKNS